MKGAAFCNSDGRESGADRQPELPYTIFRLGIDVPRSWGVAQVAYGERKVLRGHPGRMFGGKATEFTNVIPAGWLWRLSQPVKPMPP